MQDQHPGGCPGNYGGPNGQDEEGKEPRFCPDVQGRGHGQCCFAWFMPKKIHKTSSKEPKAIKRKGAK